MNLPLPTDNLYKFMAIAGLAIMGFCAYFNFTEGRYVQERADSLHTEAAMIQSDEMDMQHAESIAGPPRAALASARLAAFQERFRQIIRDARVMNAKLEALERAWDEANELKFETRIGMIAGFVLAILGFNLWYRLLQQYQDAAIRRGLVPSTMEEAVRGWNGDS